LKKTDIRNARNQSQLKSALLQLLSFKNYSAITIREITAQAKLGRSTFYSHYENKRECLKALFCDALAACTAGFDFRVPMALGSQTTQSMEAASSILYDRIQKHALIYRVAFSELTFSELVSLATPILYRNNLFPHPTPDSGQNSVIPAFLFTFSHYTLSVIFIAIGMTENDRLSKDQYLAMLRLWYSTWLERTE
jgi:hypothetical protein